MEGLTMQPTLTKVNTWILLAMTVVASVAALLYVSVTRDFLPGIVELTAALSVALIFGVVALVPRGSRQSLLRRLNGVRVGKLRYLVAAAVVARRRPQHDGSHREVEAEVFRVQRDDK